MVAYRGGVRLLRTKETRSLLLNSRPLEYHNGYSCAYSILQRFDGSLWRVSWRVSKAGPAGKLDTFPSVFGWTKSQTRLCKKRGLLGRGADAHESDSGDSHGC